MFHILLFLNSAIHCLHHTIWVTRLAEEQVIAGPGRIVLGAHGELHALNVLFEVAEGPENVLHSLNTQAINTIVSHCLVSLHLSLPPDLSSGMMHGQRLNNVSWWTL